jgi:hypothetical protein
MTSVRHLRLAGGCGDPDSVPARQLDVRQATAPSSGEAGCAMTLTASHFFPTRAAAACTDPRPKRAGSRKCPALLNFPQAVGVALSAEQNSKLRLDAHGDARVLASRGTTAPQRCSTHPQQRYASHVRAVAAPGLSFDPFTPRIAHPRPQPTHSPGCSTAFGCASTSSASRGFLQ